MKSPRTALRLALASLLIAISPLATFASSPRTGIQGQSFLYISYGTPIQTSPDYFIGIPSVQLPVVTSFTILSARTGRQVGHFTTDDDGTFNVALRPGNYVLVPDVLTLPYSRAISEVSIEFTVKPNRLASVVILYFQDGPFSLFGTTL
jgi:hypothetical protein